MPGPYSLTMSATMVMIYTILDRCGNRLNYSTMIFSWNKAAMRLKMQCHEKETMVNCKKNRCVQS